MSEETKTIEELLPCPFCGGKAERCRTDPDIDEYFIECSGCEASSGSMYGSTTEASKAWNTRTNTAERERREAAESLLEDCKELANAVAHDAPNLASVAIHLYGRINAALKESK